MKTPKEKAEELIDKFTYWNTSDAEREAIKSALACVDEIIDSIDIGFEDYKSFEKFNYWQEVKTEINNL